MLQRLSAGLLCVVSLVALPTLAGADQASSALRPGAGPLELFPAKRRPVPERLQFSRSRPRPEATVHVRDQRKLICGMTVIEANSSVDPKMAISRPADQDIEHTIRAVEPTVCWERD